MVWENSDLINDTTQAFVYELELVKDDNTFKYIGYTGTNKNWKEYIQSSEYVKKDKEYITKNATANINTLNPLQGQNKKVQCTKTLQIFDSVAIASLKTNTPPGTISHHARGKSKNPLWKFVV